jgi:iron complex outermembrane receptor protein
MQVADSSPATLKQMSLEQLMDLDVTSVSKQPEPYEQAPAAIRVITNDEILRFGASSIPEALRLADNLDVAHATSATWDISARGFNAGLSNKLLVMIDGRAVYTPLYSGVIWNAQDYLLEDIDRIEVVAGPGGSLWGANAVNGVINILSKSAKDTQGLYLEGGGGNWLKDFGAVRYGGTLEPNVYYRVYGKYFDRGAHVFADGSDASDPWRMGQGGFRLDSEADPKNRFTLQGDLYYSTVNLATGVRQDYDGGNLLARWSRPLSGDSGIQVQFYYDWTYWRDPTLAGSFGPAGTLIDNLDTFDLDIQHHFASDSHKVVWGMGYRLTHDSLQNPPSLAFLPPVLSHGLFNGFAQDEFSLAERWKLTLGSKVEHNDYTGG